jgi:hypothetical protein
LNGIAARPDDDGNYQVGERKSADEIGVRDYVSPEVVLDPRIQRDQIDTITDVIMFAEQWGYDLPTPS